MSKGMIPEAAVEAAWNALDQNAQIYLNEHDLRNLLEAAAPYMLADAFANTEAAKLELVARVAGVDAELARALGYE